MDAVHIKVQRHSYNVEIASALAIAEKCSFNSVGAREQSEFGGSHAGVAIVMSVETDDERIAVFYISANPFDLIGIHIGHGHFDRVGKVEDHLASRSGLPDVHDRFGDVFGEPDFRSAKAFGG